MSRAALRLSIALLILRAKLRVMCRRVVPEDGALIPPAVVVGPAITANK